VPSPRNDRKPNTSVSVVMKTDDARAVVFRARRERNQGSAVAATNMLMI
jgi:hypothetical protein